MIAVLYLVAILAGASAAIGAFELLTITTRPGATVFQQISSRVDVGLSLMVFVTSIGFAGVLQRLDQAAVQQTGEAPWTAIATHKGITLLKRGDLYRAEINGEWRESRSLNALKAEIDKATTAAP